MGGVISRCPDRSRILVPSQLEINCTVNDGQHSLSVRFCDWIHKTPQIAIVKSAIGKQHYIYLATDSESLLTWGFCKTLWAQILGMPLGSSSNE